MKLLDISPSSAERVDGYAWLASRSRIPFGHILVFDGDLAIDYETWEAIVAAGPRLLITGTLTVTPALHETN